MFTAQLKIAAALSLLSCGLGWALYAQIGKTAETQAALEIFQAELAAQLNENQRVNSLLIKQQKANQALRQRTQVTRRAAHEAIASKPADDCANSAIPDDLRLLIE
jgi:hypothetical protein